MKLFKRILLVLGSLLLLLMLSAFVLLRFYEDDVVKYAIDRAKSEFITKVEMGEVELSFWETFPNASLHFTDVYIEETFAAKDTLLFAHSVHFEFNLLDLFRGNYDIHTIDVEDAKCSLKRNDKGEDNWHFWKVDESDSSQFQLALKKVQLQQTHLMYGDAKTDFWIDLISEKSVGEGDFTDKQFKVGLDIEGRLVRLKSAGSEYAINKEFSTESTISADTEKEIYSFENCELRLEELLFMVNGAVNNSDKSEIQLSIVGKEIELSDLIESLTPEQQKLFAAYKPSGEIDLSITLDGETSGKKKPRVDVHAVVHDGRLKHIPSGTVVENISTELRYTGGAKSDQLRINSLQCNLSEGFIKVNGTVDHLSEPELNLHTEASIDMAHLRDFFALDTLEVCQGLITATADINGKLRYNKADSAYDWRALLTSGSAQLNNGLIRMKNSNREFSSLSGEAVFDKKNVNLKNVSGKVNGSDFRISGELNNLIPFLSSKDEQLQLNARMNCDLVDFTNLVETESSTSNNGDYRFELPLRVEFNLKSEIKKFIFRKFEANNVKGVVLMKDDKLTVDPVSFNTADGLFTAQIVMERSNAETYRLNCLAQLQQINIQKLFTEFENFDQTFIQDRHLKGIADATVQFRTGVSSALDLSIDQIESIIDISIANGELNNLESLQDIAGYIKSNKLVAPFVNEDKFAEKMKSITFSKLENVIEIKDRLITIPLMDIHSSALDISARGTHTFDNKIDYSVGFNLRDVLVRKEKEWQETDDGLGKRLYISMKGTTEDPRFSMDKELARDVRQQEMQMEKQNVKALLKEELGLFKRDHSIGSYKEKAAATGTVTTTVEWEDSNSSQNKTESAPKEVPKKEETPVKDVPKKKVPKWLKEKE